MSCPDRLGCPADGSDVGDQGLGIEPARLIARANTRLLVEQDPDMRSGRGIVALCQQRPDDTGEHITASRHTERVVHAVDDEREVSTAPSIEYPDDVALVDYDHLQSDGDPSQRLQKGFRGT